MTELSDKLYSGLKADAERISAEVIIDDLCKRIEACTAGVAALQADRALWQGRAAWLAAKIELSALAFTSEDWLRKSAAHWRDITAANKALREEVAALRELLNVHNLGGWTDAETIIKARDAAHAAMRQALLDEDPMTVLRAYLEKAGIETP